MATIIYKSSKSAVAVTLPTFRTREQARSVASKIRAAGVIPTTPTKTANGWIVTAKHNGGTLSLNNQR